jgi:16S rRNA (uracil1498-N3)-methyltransferase
MSFSNIELYYSYPPGEQNNNLKIAGEEVFHILKVMRHVVGDEIFTTDGMGNIYKTQITELDKNEIETKIIEKFSFENKFQNYFFCIPNLKSTGRLEFALEKSVELGITKFVLFNSERTVSKSFRTKRLEKILISAMKQSLQPFLPEIIFTGTIQDIAKLSGRKLVFEQNASKAFDVSLVNDKSGDFYFIFGPEGGLSQIELNLFDHDSQYKLAENRLRTETAIVKLASIM